MPNKILIVEDNEDARSVIKLSLEQNGFEVIEATDGYEAVELAKEEHPDLILMDMSLPGMDGLAATRRIKNSEGGLKVPVICITAHGNFYNEKAMAAGCESIVSKPVTPDMLNTVISMYL